MSKPSISEMKETLETMDHPCWCEWCDNCWDHKTYLACPQCPECGSDDTMSDLDYRLEVALEAEAKSKYDTTNWTDADWEYYSDCQQVRSLSEELR